MLPGSCELSRELNSKSSTDKDNGGPQRFWALSGGRFGLNSVSVKTSQPPSLTLAVALPKGDRQKWLIEKLTELGVTRLIPLRTVRGVAAPTAAAIERLRRGVIEACKQCGRCQLLQIAEASTLESLGTQQPTAQRLLADPGGLPLAAAVASTGSDLLAAIGPEGGFTVEEIATAEAAGFKRVSLGPHILRIETAAIAMAAAYRLT